MRRIAFAGVLSVFAVSVAAAGCCKYTKAEVVAYCTSHPNDSNCLAYCQAHPAECAPYMGGQSGSVTGGTGGGGCGGKKDASPPSPDLAPPEPDGPPPYVPSCPAIEGYSIEGNGCAGPYVTDATMIVPSLFIEGQIDGLAAGQLLKAPDASQVYAIVQTKEAGQLVLRKTVITPDKLLSWSNDGCSRDCMAVQPPSPNGCAMVKQIPADTMALIQTAEVPVPYKPGSVLLVYHGADYVMSPASSPSWTVHEGDMYVVDLFNLGNTAWRTLHRVLSEDVAKAMFPNVTEAVKRAIGPSDMGLFSLTQWYDLDGVVHVYEPTSTCGAASGDSQRIYEFQHVYPPAP